MRKVEGWRKEGADFCVHLSGLYSSSIMACLWKVRVRSFYRKSLLQGITIAGDKVVVGGFGCLQHRLVRESPRNVRNTYTHHDLIA